jgi:hypothetical protein
MRWSTLVLIIACAALMIGSAFAQGTDVPGSRIKMMIEVSRTISLEERASRISWTFIQSILLAVFPHHSNKHARSHSFPIL